MCTHDSLSWVRSLEFLRRWAMDDSCTNSPIMVYGGELMDPGPSLRENTGGCGESTVLGQGASDIRGATMFSPWSESVPPLH